MLIKRRNLVRARKRMRYSQKQLAKIVGIARNEMSRIETGLRFTINMKTLLKISIALECPIYDLFFKELEQEMRANGEL